MSEKMARRQRLNMKLLYMAAFAEWLAEEPPMWKIWAWAAWKRRRPGIRAVKHKGCNLLLTYGQCKICMPRFKDL